MRHSSFAAIAALALVLFTPDYSFAQDTAAAEALFRSAQEAAKQGDWVTACDRFEESNRLDPAPGTVLNIARCRENLGQFASAWQAYQEAAERLPAGDRRSTYAKNKADELDAKVPRITFSAPVESDGNDFPGEYSVTVNGTVFNEATLGVPLPFDPGDITIVVSSEGYEDRTAVIQAVESQSIEHQLELGVPLGSEQNEQVLIDAPPKGERRGTGRRTSAIVLLSVGGVGVVTGAAGAIWAAMELPKAKEPYCINGMCGQQGADASARGRTAVIVTGVGAGVAAVGLGIGTYLLMTSPPKDHGSQSLFEIVPLKGGGMLTLQARLGSDMLIAH